MTAQPFDNIRFNMFLITSLLVVFVAQSFGLMIGAYFNVVVSSAVALTRYQLLSTNFAPIVGRHIFGPNSNSAHDDVCGIRGFFEGSALVLVLGQLHIVSEIWSGRSGRSNLWVGPADNRLSWRSILPLQVRCSRKRWRAKLIKTFLQVPEEISARHCGKVWPVQQRRDSTGSVLVRSQDTVVCSA